MDWKNRKTQWYETVSAARNFPFLKEVSQNCFIFDVVTALQNEEVSQNCFVFDLVKFKNWGRLAELLRFWCCQLWKTKKSRKIPSFLTLSSSNIEEVRGIASFLMLSSSNIEESRRIAEFLTLSSSNIEEVSQNCCVFGVVKFKTWGRLTE